MDRKTKFRGLIVLAAILAAFLAGAAPAAGERPPNVVLIVSDDQGWTDFGFMGHEAIRTPHLDRLAAESAFFPRGYVPTPLCRASLATLLTGLYPAQHRICCNDPPGGSDRSAMLVHMRRAPALPRLLGKAGYASLQTGKFWEGHYSNAGFTSGMTTKGRHGEEGLAIGRQTMQPIRDFVAEHRERPFFIWYAPMMPHEPHNPPQRILEKYQTEGRHERLAKYYAMCEWFDETCGELLGIIEQAGLRERTLVLFCVDNGWIEDTGPTVKKHGLFDPRSKLSPYDGGIRTPVLLRWPGRIEPGRRDDLVSTIDIAPTILSACGAPVPEELPGLSLLDAAAGKDPLPRRAVFGEVYLHTAVDIDNPAPNLTHLWVREEDWKLILRLGENRTAELYNLAKDPFEKKDLAGDHPERVRRLTRLIEERGRGS